MPRPTLSCPERVNLAVVPPAPVQSILALISLALRAMLEHQGTGREHREWTQVSINQVLRVTLERPGTVSVLLGWVQVTLASTSQALRAMWAIQLIWVGPGIDQG